MMNGFGSPPNIDQRSLHHHHHRNHHRQQQQQHLQLEHERDASDYLGLSATKSDCNSHDMNGAGAGAGAALLVAQTSDGKANANVPAATQLSQHPVADDIRQSKSASSSDSKEEKSWNEKTNDENPASVSPTDGDAGSRLRHENERIVDQTTTRSCHPDEDKKKAEKNRDNNLGEEADEVPCLVPFVSVDSIEDMVDPLLDTDEPGDSASKMCHNGDGPGERNGDDDDDDDDESDDGGSSVEFVCQESAIADDSSSVQVESDVQEEGVDVDVDVAVAVDVDVDVDVDVGFRCNECGHSFATEGELELHTQTSDVASLCEQCDSTFWSPCALNRHKSEHAAAAVDRVAYAAASGYRADAVAVAVAVAVASFQQAGGSFAADKRYACQHCGAGYTTRFNLTRHLRKNLVWSKNGQPFKCDLCDAIFPARCLLPIHKRQAHAEFTDLDFLGTEDSMNYVETSLDTEPESVIVTPQFDLLERECDSLDEGPFAAAAAAATTTSYHTFRTATAAGVSYNCKWCPERVPSHPALIRHIVETHPEVQLYRCEPCDKTFLNKAGLYGHLTHHRFQCEKCELNFSSEALLRDHRMASGHDAPAPSSVDSSARSRLSAVAKWTGARARSAAAAKSKCDGMPYFELVARVPHMRKPFECEFCDKTFSYKTTFLEHYLTHTGERPFRCSVCGQGFIRLRAMQIHATSHRLPGQPTAAPPDAQPQHSSIPWTRLSPPPPPPPLAHPLQNVTVVDGRRQTARKSTSAPLPPSCRRANPIGRLVVNDALFDPQLDVTAEDQEAFYYLPVVSLKMVDVSSLEEHAYVCPYCDKFFGRPSSLCGHKKICSYLTRVRAQKASAAALGLPMPIVPRKWTPRIAGVSSVAAMGGGCGGGGGGNFYTRPEDSTVVIAGMRHHIVFERGERIFVCGVCGKQFARKFTLGEHCRSHTTDRPFLCDRCPRAFKRKSSLFRHRRRNHAKLGPDHQSAFVHQHPMADQNWMSFEPQCNVKIEFDGDDDDDDEDEDDDTPGEDDDVKPLVGLGGTGQCQYYAQQASLPAYEYSDEEMSVFEPQCIVKDEVASDEENCNADGNEYYPADDCHQLVDTSMNHFLEVGLTTAATATADGNNGQSWRHPDEEDAPQPTAADGALAELAYEQLEQLEQRQQQQQQLAAAPVDRFLCGECNRRFPRREDLRRHFAEHASVGPFKCFYCEKTFDRRKYLSKHARNHDKKKSYQCSYCERAYVTNAELTIHVRIHTGERPFECDQCGKGFRVQKQLTLHYRTHTGEKPYACAHCPSTFSRHETLFRHNRVCQAKSVAASAAAAASTAHPHATPQLSQLLRQPPPLPPPSPPSQHPQPSYASPDHGSG